jgi:ribosome-binding factor A
MSSRRQLRVAELLQHELAQMISFDLRDPRLAFVSVTRVQVSPDLLHATVFVSQLMGDNSPKETLAALDHARGYMRRELGLRTKLRYVPELKFQYDEGMAEGLRISALIDEVAAADSPASAGSEADDL